MTHLLPSPVLSTQQNMLCNTSSAAGITLFCIVFKLGTNNHKPHVLDLKIIVIKKRGC